MLVNLRSLWFPLRPLKFENSRLLGQINCLTGVTRLFPHDTLQNSVAERMRLSAGSTLGWLVHVLVIVFVWVSIHFYLTLT